MPVVRIPNILCACLSSDGSLMASEGTDPLQSPQGSWHQHDKCPTCSPSSSPEHCLSLSSRHWPGPVTCHLPASSCSPYRSPNVPAVASPTWRRKKNPIDQLRYHPFLYPPFYHTPPKICVFLLPPIPFILLISLSLKKLLMKNVNHI